MAVADPFQGQAPLRHDSPLRSSFIIILMLDIATLPHFEELSSIVDGIIESGINFIALDFDFTLIDLHTRGQWDNDDPKSLLTHVRPVLKTFMTLALSRSNLFNTLHPDSGSPPVRFIYCHGNFLTSS
jgi:hypothetical protein